MHEHILQFDKQLEKGKEIVGSIRAPANYNRIVVCGTGGSIIAGMMLLTWHEHRNKGPGVPVLIHNNYDLPSDITSEDLVICISWSGKTEETISALQTAIKRNINAIAITKDGQLGKLAKKNNVPLVTLPDEKSAPRNSVGYMLGALFTVLGLEKELDIKIDAAGQEKSGKELAEKIGSKTPLIYTSYSWRKLASFWKISFNETSKAPAYWNYTPSMAHNEIAMYTRPDLPFYPIIFRDNNNEARHARDLTNTIAILNKQEYNYSIVDLSSSDLPLETILNNYILGLWTSYYLAQKLGTDPTDIKLIEEFKTLKSNSNSKIA